MNKIAIAAVVVLAALGAGYVYFSGQESDSMEDVAMAKEEAIKTDSMEDGMDDPVKKDDMKDDMSEDMDSSMTSGTYEAYVPEKLARAETGKVVLFFKASWCPTCRALDADIKASLDDLPDGLTILEVDYDTATELRQKYGVTNQHTLVQVDSKGDQITKWSGGLTLETVLEKLI